jgi:hypothetical protein
MGTPEGVRFFLLIFRTKLLSDDRASLAGALELGSISN